MNFTTTMTISAALILGLATACVDDRVDVADSNPTLEELLEQIAAEGLGDAPASDDGSDFEANFAGGEGSECELQPGGLSCNGLVPEMLTAAQPDLARLAERRLALGTGLGDVAHILAPEVTHLMGGTTAGRRTLAYAFACALGSDDRVAVIDHTGASHEYRGRLGVAREWLHRPLTSDSQRALSACILAHVNETGATVVLSVRDYAQIGTTEEEVAKFPYYEATFYGDLFSATPAMYVCSGSQAPSELASSDRDLRRCSEAADGDPTRSRCGFTLVGACSEVCDASVEGSYQGCRSGDGQRFEATASAWLR